MSQILILVIMLVFLLISFSGCNEVSTPNTIDKDATGIEVVDYIVKTQWNSESGEKHSEYGFIHNFTPPVDGERVSYKM